MIETVYTIPNTEDRIDLANINYMNYQYFRNRNTYKYCIHFLNGDFYEIKDNDAYHKVCKAWEKYKKNIREQSEKDAFVITRDDILRYMMFNAVQKNIQG